MTTLTHDPDVLAQVVGDRPVADYTPMPTSGRPGRCPISFCRAKPGEPCVSSNGRLRSDHASRCQGSHRTDDAVGYVVRRTLDNDGDAVPRPGQDGALGVDVYAVACQPGWGNYDKAVTAARAYRSGRSYAVVDTLYRCGHRSPA